MLNSLLFRAATFAGAVAAAANAETNAVCSALYKAYPALVVFDPLTTNGAKTLVNASYYNTANFEYWNAENSNNRAACTFFPSNAKQVAFAVRELNKYPSATFAIKSGGHNPNLGFSSIEQGVLIAFRPNSQYAIPAANGETVNVGAGAKWEDVYKVLEPLNRAVVGGRLGDIGVTGFTLGGGLSYLSAQYGLACDNVEDFEVVLANGTITHASATSNPDLFYAMKGGGNQFAIVTSMILKTYTVGTKGQVWGGIRVYSGDDHSSIFEAIADFVTNNDDPRAAVIPTNEFIGLVADVPAPLVFFFYDASEPAAGVFDKFDSIDALVDDTTTQTYYELTQVALAGDVEGFRFQIRMNTFPNLPVTKMTNFLDDHWDLAKNYTTTQALADLVDVKIFTFTVQPMTRLIAQASQNAGGNVYNLKPEYGDRVWMEYDLGWGSAACDDDCPGYVQTVADAAHDLQVSKYGGIAPTNYTSGDVKYISYNPIFMNDAMYNQDVLKSFGSATYQRLKGIKDAYDPKGFFTTRTLGFKF